MIQSIRAVLAVAPGPGRVDVGRPDQVFNVAVTRAEPPKLLEIRKRSI